jgi:hypothetical protein
MTQRRKKREGDIRKEEEIRKERKQTATIQERVLEVNGIGSGERVAGSITLGESKLSHCSGIRPILSILITPRSQFVHFLRSF